MATEAEYMAKVKEILDNIPGSAEQSNKLAIPLFFFVEHRITQIVEGKVDKLALKVESLAKTVKQIKDKLN